ncbi:sensor histidine kinase [Neobacillus cucumis]|uniref:cache domain-containing sensor histidine kinase n=1 Tax=Neobacillus cucumis TaxID=1740721 RepID=UPI002E1F6326|nr:sensor histidine kinase [Neobacillus cucumis]
MEMVDRIFKNKSLYFKLICIFILIIVMSVTISTALSVNQFTNVVEDQANAHTLSAITTVKNSIELQIHELDNITTYISENDDSKSFFQNNMSSKVEEKLKKQLNMYTVTKPNIAGILIVNSHDYSISNEMSRISRDPLTNESWYKQAAASPKTFHLDSRPIGRNIKTTKNYGADEVLSLTKAVTDEKTGKVLGVILIDWKLDAIKSEIEHMGFGSNGFVYVMDDSSQIVYSPVNPIVYRINGKWFHPSGSGSVIKRINNTDYQMMYDHSSYTKWVIVGAFSINETFLFIQKVKWIAILIAMIVSVFAIIVAAFFTSSITKPLVKLRSLMKKAEEGNLDIKFESNNDDEIKQLGDSFNSMIGSIKKLMHVINEIEKRKREAELKVLQEQIKPHFLYNTLDTIRWMAQEYEARDIMAVIDALTNLFRIGLSKGKESIKVSQEIEHVKSYLIIQMTRYEEKFDYEIHVEDSVKDLYVLKLILQPLVENSIYHAIKTKRGKGKISIFVNTVDNNLCLSVIDNGSGMVLEDMHKWNELLKSQGMIGKKSEGYGMLNVNERIKLSFGNDYGLQIDSVEGKGTKVEIKHPILRENTNF